MSTLSGLITPTNILTASNAETLTNKTIGFSTNTFVGTNGVANGGTGAATLTANSVLVGNGTSAVQTVAPGTSGNILTSNGTSWASVAAAGGNEFSFTASGEITSGKAVVLNTTGTVTQSLIAAQSSGTPVTLSGNNTDSISVCHDPVADRFVVFYRDTSDGNKGKAVVGTVSGNSVSYGTPVVFFNAAITTGSANNIDSCYDEDTGQIIVAFSETGGNLGQLVTCSVSGTTATFGTVLSTGDVTTVVGVCYDTSVNRVLMNYKCIESGQERQKARVISVSGTTLSLVSVATLLSSQSNGYTSSVVHCTGFGTVGSNVAICNTSGQATLFRLTINPSTFAITVGSATTIPGDTGYSFGTKTLAWSSSAQALIAIKNNGPDTYYLQASFSSLSGVSGFTNINNANVDFDAYSTPSSNFPSVACSPDGLSACLVFPDPGVTFYGKLIFSTSVSVAGGLSFGSAIQFQTSNVGWTSVAYTSDSLKVLVGYSITSGLGRSVVATAPVPDSRTRFIGFAKSTVSSGGTVIVKTLGGVSDGQTSLSPGTNYYLSSSDGSTLSSTISGPKVGRALSATQLLVLGTNIYL